VNADLREISSNAIRFWERCRVVYNAVLGIIVGVCFIIGLPNSRETISVDGALGFFLLVVGANVLFCAAYIPDLFAQLSIFRVAWLRYRWIVFTIGLICAGILTRWIAMESFGLGRD
jgi:hypothetical protein